MLLVRLKADTGTLGPPEGGHYVLLLQRQHHVLSRRSAGATATSTCRRRSGCWRGTSCRPCAARGCGSAEPRRELAGPGGHGQDDELASADLIGRWHPFGSGGKLHRSHFFSIVAVVGAEPPIG